MKILYVCTTTDRGGAENALRALALVSRRENHAVKVICLKPAGVVAQELRTAGVDVLSLEINEKFNPFQTAGALARLVSEIKNFQPDVVHAFLYRAIQLCRQAKKYVSFRLITTPHYAISKQNYFKRLWDRALKNADDVSCAESEQTAHFLTEKQKYAPEKVRLVCNGVDSVYFAPDPQARKSEREKLGFKENEIVFCCVARLAKEKNHITLLRAFEKMQAKNPLVRLVLVGDGPGKPHLEAFLKEHRLKKAVVCAGEVADVRPYLQAADVFVLASKEESLPLALLEAGACGLPAIASKVGDMPQVVGHGVGGFVFNPADFVILSVLMAELAQNAKLREIMGKNARTRTEQKYPPAEPIYLQIYKEIN
jgi:glycosyltransferase involved in cell wall biosynthesis